MVHAENGHMIADAIAGLIGRGQVAEHEHLHAHPDVSEQEAVHRAIGLAEYVGTPLFIVHVSSGQAVDEILAGQQRGIDVMAETCPQYLVTGYEDYAALGFEAAGYACSPPIRERSNQERLWRGLAEGTLSTIGTDHAAFTLSQPDDLPPQKGQGRGYFPSIPNGVPGVEERLMVMYQAGVIERGLSMSRLVELTSTAPAKTFGLYPRKGLLAPGSDADIVVWDPAAPRTLGVAGQHSRADYSVYEGYQVAGSPRLVLAGGELVVSHGELDAVRGRGSYLLRESPSLLPAR
jgi:dihydropyrimidinase